MPQPVAIVVQAEELSLSVTATDQVSDDTDYEELIVASVVRKIPVDAIDQEEEVDEPSGVASDQEEERLTAISEQAKASPFPVAVVASCKDEFSPVAATSQARQRVRSSQRILVGHKVSGSSSTISSSGHQTVAAETRRQVNTGI